MNITFSLGTILLDCHDDSCPESIKHLVKYDERVKQFRAPANHYSEIILTLRENKIKHTDNAAEYIPIDLQLNSSFPPREHQKTAIKKWIENKYNGIIAMPTGSGKSYFAVMAINYIKRSTLIVVPTIDLMQQWSSQLETYFNCKIGLLGGGVKDVQDITVTTYDSAVLQMEFIGNKFALLIFDECHHLPGPTNRLAATMSIAPYRIGLTATPDTEEETQALMTKLIGPIAYEIHIDELENKVLSPYLTKQIFLHLEPDEFTSYQTNRKTYTDFLKRNRINFNQQNAWQQFIIMCARQPDGKEVLKAFMEQKNIARRSRNKYRKVWELLKQHKGERIIIFTADNETAYNLGNTFFLPVLTHRTKLAERKDFLAKFKSGEYSVLITSKVLNEGVDVPEASVGIIVSGSGSIREHVQRLGRILRPKEEKQAVLYELISQNTSEMNVSERRRNHRAYG